VRDEICRLNEVGKSPGDRLDGERSLRQIASAMEANCVASTADVDGDVTVLMAKLTQRNMLVLE
jgi:hypothetical protein